MGYFVYWGVVLMFVMVCWVVVGWFFWVGLGGVMGWVFVVGVFGCFVFGVVGIVFVFVVVGLFVYCCLGVCFGFWFVYIFGFVVFFDVFGFVLLFVVVFVFVVMGYGDIFFCDGFIVGIGRWWWMFRESVYWYKFFDFVLGVICSLLVFCSRNWKCLLLVNWCEFLRFLLRCFVIMMLLVCLFLCVLVVIMVIVIISWNRLSSFCVYLCCVGWMFCWKLLIVWNVMVCWMICNVCGIFCNDISIFCVKRLVFVSVCWWNLIEFWWCLFIGGFVICMYELLNVLFLVWWVWNILVVFLVILLVSFGNVLFCVSMRLLVSMILRFFMVFVCSSLMVNFIMLLVLRCRRVGWCWRVWCVFRCWCRSMWCLFIRVWCCRLLRVFRWFIVICLLNVVWSLRWGLILNIMISVFVDCWIWICKLICIFLFIELVFVGWYFGWLVYVL